jgi:hypothetical protein
LIAGIKIEDDMEVDATGQAIIEVAEEEENDIDIDDEEVINLGASRLPKTDPEEADLLQSEIQESMVMDIQDNKTLTKKYTMEENEEASLGQS